MKLIITNKRNGITSTTPYVEAVTAEKGGLVVVTMLPTQNESRAEFIKWDDDLTYELRKG